MILSVDNILNAKVGDEVEIDLKTSNFLLATVIAYGLPLFGLLLGTIGSYYAFILLGFQQSDTQGLSAIIGLAFLIMTFLVIRANESKISKLNQFKPIIVSVNDKNK